MARGIVTLGMLAGVAVAWPQAAEAGAVGSDATVAPTDALPGCDAPATEREAGEREPRPAPPNANCDLPDAKEPADRIIDNSIQGLTDGVPGTKVEPRHDLVKPDPDHDREVH